MAMDKDKLVQEIGTLLLNDPDKELCEAMREAGKDPWKACLVRIDRSSKAVSIDFEYDHPEKWLIVPSTVRQMAEVLRHRAP